MSFDATEEPTYTDVRHFVNDWAHRPVHLHSVGDQPAVPVAAASWRDRANCLGLDVDMFFPSAGGPLGDEARAVCAACEVREDCQNYAIENAERYGIWGGMTARELRRRRQANGRANAAVHGSRSKYQSGCRCNACRAANARHSASRQWAR